MSAQLAHDVLASALAWLVRALLVALDLAPPPSPAPGTDVTLSGPLAYVGRIDGAPYDHFGWTVKMLEDLDGDGVREIVVGMRPWVPGLTTGIGKVAVHSGRTRARLWEQAGRGQPEDDIGASVDAFGASLATPGDLTGDGRADLLAGGGDWFFGSAYVRLLSGADGAVVQTWEVENGSSGWPIEVGDLDADGHPEFGLVLNAFRTGLRTELFAGRDRSLMRKLPFELLGRTGDVDGDGALDFVQRGKGLAVVRGPAVGEKTKPGDPLAPVREWAELVSLGRTESGTKHSWRLSGDHDGDGCADLVAVDYLPGRQANRMPPEERAFDLRILCGRNGKLLLESRLALDPPGALGHVGSAGDLDGDGKDELVVVRSADGARLEVLSSAADWTVLASATSRSWSFGGVVVNAGDLDGDGAPELLIGDLEHTGGGRCAGAVHVLSWRPERK